MNKNKRQLLLKGFIGSCFWCIVTILIGIVIINRFNYSLKDVLFVEGIILIITGLLSSIGGNSNGLSFQTFGSLNGQYDSNINLEITRKEREKVKDVIKTTISIGCSTMALVIGGIFNIIINLLL